MSFKQAVKRNKVSGLMFGSTFNTGRCAPHGGELVAAQERQARNVLLMNISATWAKRHGIGIKRARDILSELIEDYRNLSAGPC